MTSTMCSVSIVNFESFVPCDFSTSTCQQFLLQKIGKNLWGHKENVNEGIREMQTSVKKIPATKLCW